MLLLVPMARRRRRLIFGRPRGCVRVFGLPIGGQQFFVHFQPVANICSAGGATPAGRPREPVAYFSSFELLTST